MRDQCQTTRHTYKCVNPLTCEMTKPESPGMRLVPTPFHRCTFNGTLDVSQLELALPHGKLRSLTSDTVKRINAPANQTTETIDPSHLGMILTHSVSDAHQSPTDLLYNERHYSTDHRAE